jgi:hypothetical protein
MAGKKISVNISGTRPAVMASKSPVRTSMNARQQNASPTNEVTRAMKNVREWKIVNGESRMEHSWYLKDKQAANGEQIILYCVEFEHVQASYQSLGMLRDICLVPGTYIVYALVKQSKTYLKIRYCLNMSNYKKEENFTELCAMIVTDIEMGNVSLLILIFVACIIISFMIIVKSYLTMEMTYFIFTGFC